MNPSPPDDARTPEHDPAGQLSNPAKEETRKSQELEPDVEDSTGQPLTTNTGLRINDDQNTLSAGERGPSLLEDFHFREKMTHFDHERIPERVVHARGSGAHGFFQAYAGQARLTRAGFLQNPDVKTPVFVRFSTVAGSRGSTDMARDVRGFAVKFYTDEGIFDLVANNIPVFFIQDAVKFPDLVHAVKPEQDNEMPQASSAHDTFWDFISLMPESMHMIMWVMSDRAIPRSFRMMEGFGVNTFRLVDAQGVSRFVKFHWKPVLGTHAVAWDEAQKISGKDPDFLRRDLWEAIDLGAFPEWELGVQVIEQADEHKFDFDLLDATKLIPEELVPVQRIGKLTLNRNPDNFFAETEQVAFHPGHVVPGIDFSNDPLLQGRLFSYTDTQLLRLGGPNFQEIPINRSLAPVHNNQREGLKRHTINRGKASYQPNSIGGGCPMQVGRAAGGFTSTPEKMQGVKARVRSDKFFDHFSQAALFYLSQTPVEQDHIVEALTFELGRVARVEIRERMVGMLSYVDASLAARVAEGLGMPSVPKVVEPLNHGAPADAEPPSYEPKPMVPPKQLSPSLTMLHPDKIAQAKKSIVTRKICVLVADGTDADSLEAVMDALREGGAMPKLVAPRLGVVRLSDGSEETADFSLLTGSSVLFDALYIPGGAQAAKLLGNERGVVEYVMDTFRHFKVIGATGEGVDVLRAVLGPAVGGPPVPGAVPPVPGAMPPRQPRPGADLTTGLDPDRLGAELDRRTGEPDTRLAGPVSGGVIDAGTDAGTDAVADARADTRADTRDGGTGPRVGAAVGRDAEADRDLAPAARLPADPRTGLATDPISGLVIDPAFAPAFARLPGPPAPGAEPTRAKTELGIITDADGATSTFTTRFVDAIAQHRYWTRETKKLMPELADLRLR